MQKNSTIADVNQSRRIGLLRVSMLLAFGSFLLYSIFYCFYDFKFFLPANISIWVYLLINAVVFVFFKFRKYLLAIHLFSSILILEMLVLTVYIFGKSPGLHFYFILFAFVPLPLFPIKKIRYPIIYFIISLSCFLCVEFLNPIGIIEYPHIFILPVKLTTIILSLSTTMFLLVLYYSMSEKKEIELHEAKQSLEFTNRELAESNTEIKAQKENLTELNKSLTDANKTKNLFFSIISHDLKNPLSALIGLIELLLMRVDSYDTNKIKTMLETISLSANGLQTLILNLLEWSKTQTGIIEAKFAPCVLKEVIQTNKEMCNDLAQQKNIKFDFYVPQNLVWETDESILGTILRNLFTNAIKYSHKGDEITVSATQHEQQVVLSIKDNGVGMSDDTAKNLFKIDKVHSTPGTNQEEGTGLGLIITYEFVKILNGTIDIKCGEDKGCEFIICLPKISKN